MSRLSDKDTQYGPLTLGVSKRSDGGFTMSFKAEREDYYIQADDRMIEKDVNRLYVFVGRYSLRLELPCLVKTEVVIRPRYNDPTLPGHPEHHSKEYGFSICEGNLLLQYGMQCDSYYVTNGRKVKCYSIPWMVQRLETHELHRPDGTVHYSDAVNRAGLCCGRGFNNPEGIRLSELFEEAKKTWPGTVFLVRDLNGKSFKVIGKLEYWKYRRGTGLFKWLGYLTKPLEYRTLNLEFTDGKPEDSLYIRPDETPFIAMYRYCSVKLNATLEGRQPDEEGSF